MTDIHLLHQQYYDKLGIPFTHIDKSDFDYHINIEDKAMGGLYYHDNVTEVVSIFVHPDCRNQGLGNKVLKDLHSQRDGIYRLSTYF